MWYYAGGGSGIRIWVDSDKIETEHRHFLKVRYLEERPAQDLATLTSYEINQDWVEFLHQVMTSKSKAWEYEQECRLCVSFRAGIDEVKVNGEFEFINIPASAIRQIDFGAKGFIEDTTKNVEEIRRRPEFYHIKFRVATFSDRNYEYKYVDYDL